LDGASSDPVSKRLTGDQSMGTKKAASSQNKPQSALFEAIRWVRDLHLPSGEKAVLFGLAS
jgi:hypothetical protein